MTDDKDQNIPNMENLMEKGIGMCCIGYSKCLIRIRQRESSYDRPGYPCQYEFSEEEHKYNLGSCYRSNGPLPKDVSMEPDFKALVWPGIGQTLKDTLGFVLHIPVVVSDKVPVGECWVFSPITEDGEPTMKMTNIQVEKDCLTYKTHLKKPLSYVSMTLIPENKDDK